MNNHLVSDFLIRLKNAYLSKRKTVKVNYSSMIFAIAKILKEKDFLSSVKEIKDGNKRFIEIMLLYKDKEPAISEVKIISKPSIHVYADSKNLPKTKGRYGITIISTSKGIMTGWQAKKDNLGGEVICQVN